MEKLLLVRSFRFFSFCVSLTAELGQSMTHPSPHSSTDVLGMVAGVFKRLQLVGRAKVELHAQTQNLKLDGHSYCKPEAERQNPEEKQQQR